MAPFIAWAVLGLALLIIEIFTMTFALVFFGMAALIVSVLAWSGMDNITLQILVFTVLGIVDMFLLRKRLMSALQAKKNLPMDESQHITLTADVPAGQSAQIMYQGATWIAINETAVDFKKGDNAVIARMDGVKIVLGRF